MVSKAERRKAKAAKRKAWADGAAQQPTGPFDETVRDFLSPSTFFDMLYYRGVTQYYGVPDSLMKDFLSCLYDRTVDMGDANMHILTANEGSAIAGYVREVGAVVRVSEADVPGAVVAERPGLARKVAVEDPAHSRGS